MIDIDLFESIENLKAFTREKQKDGKIFYVFKFVVTYNPFTRSREYHVWWSADPRLLQQGMHMNHKVQTVAQGVKF